MRDLVRSSRDLQNFFRSGIDRFFADAFFRNWPFSAQEMFPPVDLYQTDNSLVALIDLPGVETKDVEVTATVDSLTISGEFKPVSEDGEVLWQERSAGKFYRSFKLPVHIKSDKVEANYKNGVLRIVMPKVDELKSSSIRIKES